MKWFKHDSDANLDAKLQNVLLDYGLEGYGLYWYCIELIVGKISQDNITFQLEHDARIIARNTGSTRQKVEEMMKYFVDQGLFQESEGRITCLKLAQRLDKSMTSNQQMRSLIDEIKNHDNVMTQSCKTRLDKNRSDKKRIVNSATGVAPDRVIDLYNSFFKDTNATQKRLPTDALKQSIKHRQNILKDEDDWTAYFEKVKSIDFLMGLTQSQNRRPFKLTIDWLVKPANLAKVTEGYYDG